MMWVVVFVGIAMLVGLATLIGFGMDTEARRVEWREVASERRLRNDELRTLREERLQLHQERLLFAKQQQELCAHCPLRGPTARDGDDS
jgi:hypothetical protein